MLDYGKVHVKPASTQTSRVPGTPHYEAIRREIVRLVQQERKRRNLSRYAVSQNSGVSESMLSLVERGLRNPTMELMLRIADGIGADLPRLIRAATESIRKETRNQVSNPGGTQRPPRPRSRFL